MDEHPPSTVRQRSLRRLGLFVLTMSVPSLVLVALGVQVARQQDELAEKHAADARLLRRNDFERALLDTLNRVRQRQHPDAIAIRATIVERRLILPWDMDRSTAPANPRFESALRAAEYAEFSPNPSSAVAAAEHALTLATTAAEKAHARLVTARVTSKLGGRAEAKRVYRTILDEPLTATDALGVPFALYAAERLATDEAAGEHRDAVAGLIRRGMALDLSLPPVGWYLLRSASRACRARGDFDAPSIERVESRIADVETALALQREFASVAGRWRASEQAWLPFGARWLLGVTRGDGGEQHVLAVNIDRVLAGMAETYPALAGAVLSTDGEGDWLGESTPGIKVRFAQPPQPPDDVGLQRRFYVAALVIVLGVTCFGGLLLWRDVQRELRVAELRSQFVASVSHELRTPLTAIRLFAETLQGNRVTGPARDEYLDTIVNESERLTRLLDNVLDFSHIEHGRKAYRFASSSLADVVRTAAKAMSYPFEQRGFALHLDIDESIPPQRIDADALQQAILNLLTNAMKYSGTGRHIELRLSRKVSPDEAVVSVVDQGVGIPQHEVSRIFDKFYRVPSPDHERVAGTGLGLTLVDHIVKAHGGRVRVETAVGRGSTFSLHLPLDEATA